MERLYYYTQQRESVVVGPNNGEIERGGSYTSPSTPNRSPDVDFNDVFGGPPRRSSVNEIRRSLSPLQLQDLRSGGGEGGDEAGPCSPAWPAAGGEKPVFGEDSGIRRRYPNKSNDFFDDIFGGEESPRVRGDRDPLSSRVLSPALPLPEPVASSLPSAFSLPPKLTKGGDLPTFGSSTRSKNPLNNIKEGIATPTSNGLGSSDFPLSRFSTKHKEESKNDLKPPNRPSLLSKEFSDISDKGSNMKQDKSISEVSPGSCNGQFHFSIYKWASKGVPLVMPLRAERKEKFKLERCSSTKEWKVSEITTQNVSPIAYNASLLSKRQQDGPTTYTTIQTGADSHQIVEQMASAKAQSDTLSCLQTVIKDVSGNPISSNARAESNTDSVSETRFLGKTGSASENQKLESKSLRSLLNKSDEKQDYDEITERERREESKMKSSKKSSAIFDINMNPKKSEEKKVPLEGLKHSKAASQGSLGLAENMGKDQAKGKVKEFVRIFNQEAVTKPRVDSKSKVSTYKQRDALRKKKEVEDNLEQPKKENSAMESSSKSADNLSQQDEISAPAVPDTSFAVIGDTDQSFHGNFTIQVLAEDENDALQNQDNQEIQVIDNKIQQWSKGKEGNIRSLLSTLQYVLWPGCGWKPVPLVDIIEGNAVKRAYQRALLCLHPDKLQQKGAASHQKYVAEKVFDILQEAWTQFSMIGAL